MRLQQIFREIIDTLAAAIESRIVAAWKDPELRTDARKLEVGDVVQIDIGGAFREAVVSRATVGPQPGSTIMVIPKDPKGVFRTTGTEYYREPHEVLTTGRVVSPLEKAELEARAEKDRALARRENERDKRDPEERESSRIENEQRWREARAREAKGREARWKQLTAGRTPEPPRDLEDRLRALHADIGHLVAPHRLSGQITVVAEAVDTRTAGQLAAATQLADTAAPSLSLISLRATPGVATAIQKFRSDNLGRITSLVSDQISELRGLLEEAETGSWRVEELRERIRERLDVTRSKADFLARDQTLKLNGQITRARQTQAGITHYTWSTSGDERVREEHEDLDGTIQAWDDPPVTNADGDTNHPGEDYQCRCVAIPIVPDLDTE